MARKLSRYLSVLKRRFRRWQYRRRCIALGAYPFPVEVKVITETGRLQVLLNEGWSIIHQQWDGGWYRAVLVRPKGDNNV